jgi:hypothetical protein
MDLKKFVTEIWESSYYRRTPSAVLQYAYAKWKFSRHCVHEPMTFLRDIGIDVCQAISGFDKWRPQLEHAIKLVQQADDGQGGISVEDGTILYGLVRALRPEFIVETGVAAGISTAFLGAALMENGQGSLYSIDLPVNGRKVLHCADGGRYTWLAHGVGWAIPKVVREGLANRHHLILRDVRHALPDLLEQIPFIDIFFHDDLHTPDHMLWEYSFVWPHIRPGGILVSDDSNFGWIQFCRRLGEKNEGLNIQRLTAVRKQLA